MGLPLEYNGSKQTIEDYVFEKFEWNSLDPNIKEKVVDILDATSPMTHVDYYNHAVLINELLKQINQNKP